MHGGAIAEDIGTVLPKNVCTTNRRVSYNPASAMNVSEKTPL